MLKDRWQRTRIPLLALGASDPSKRVAGLARQLEAATGSTIVWDKHLASDARRGRDTSDARDTASQHYADACKLLDELLKAIRRK